jgi:hypothetical protein
MISLNILDWIAINGLSVLFVVGILTVLLKGNDK